MTNDNLTLVPVVNPNQFEIGKLTTKVGQQPFGNFAILYVCRMNENSQYQTSRVNQQRTLAPLDFFPAS